MKGHWIQFSKKHTMNTILNQAALSVSTTLTFGWENLKRCLAKMSSMKRILKWQMCGVIRSCLTRWKTLVSVVLQQQSFDDECQHNIDTHQKENFTAIAEEREERARKSHGLKYTKVCVRERVRHEERKRFFLYSSIRNLSVVTSWAHVVSRRRSFSLLNSIWTLTEFQIKFAKVIFQSESQYFGKTTTILR